MRLPWEGLKSSVVLGKDFYICTLILIISLFLLNVDIPINSRAYISAN